MSIDWKGLRLKKGLALWQVAKFSGLSMSGYINIEKGVTIDPKPETLEKLRRLLIND